MAGEAEDRLPGARPELIPRGPVVVALSGGADSAVAAWLATSRSSEVRAVFVDHGWPGSAAMVVAARAVAGRLAIPLRVVPVQPTATETAARAVRLEVLQREAAEDPVVTGHHAGDVAETVLANLLRGAGATGLSGIPAERPPFVRPLLAVRAGDVRRAAVDLDLPFADDPANARPRASPQRHPPCRPARVGGRRPRGDRRPGTFGVDARVRRRPARPARRHRSSP